VDSVSEFFKGGSQDLGVFQVIIDKFVDFLLSLIIQAGKSSGLDNIGSAIECCGHDTIEIVTDQAAVLEFQTGRDNGPSESNTGETGVFGEGVNLNGNVLGSLNFENGFRNIIGSDEWSVCGIEDENRSAFFAELDHFSQLLLGCSSTGRIAIQNRNFRQIEDMSIIVRYWSEKETKWLAGATRKIDDNLLGGAQIDDIGTGKTGVVREKSIFWSAFHVNNVVVLHGFFVLGSGLTHHDGSVNIDGV